MGKPLDAATPRPALRCVHCSAAETPLWRTGPDGAKTLCNACGVRFKKGKLTLYRDPASGALTAVKQGNADPVVVPPPPASKKIPRKQYHHNHHHAPSAATTTTTTTPPHHPAAAVAAAAPPTPPPPPPSPTPPKSTLPSNPHHPAAMAAATRHPALPAAAATAATAGSGTTITSARRRGAVPGSSTGSHTRANPPAAARRDRTEHADDNDDDNNKNNKLPSRVMQTGGRGGRSSSTTTTTTTTANATPQPPSAPPAAAAAATLARPVRNPADQPVPSQLSMPPWSPTSASVSPAATPTTATLTGKPLVDDTTAVPKKIRSRARRMTAGQMPGRYHMSSTTATTSPPSSLSSPPPLPLPSGSSTTTDMHGAAASSPFPDGMYLHPPTQLPPPHTAEFMLHAGASAAACCYNVDEPTPYQFTDAAVDHMFADVACLGLENGNDHNSPNALCLPPMAADPSSAEHFSFPDQTTFTYSPSLVIDPPDQRTALVTLVRDRSRAPGRLYQACVRAIAQLGQRLVAKSALPSSSSAPERRRFVRDFASDNSVLGIFSVPDRSNYGHGGAHPQQCGAMAAARLMLPDRTAYDTSVDAFRAMCDCADLAIFPEDLVFQVLEDDVEALMALPNFAGPADGEFVPNFAVKHDRAGNPVPTWA